MIRDLKTEAHRLFRLLLGATEPHVCWFKGKDQVYCYGRLQVCHILKRDLWPVAWNLSNAKLGCEHHNNHYQPKQAKLEQLIDRYIPGRTAYLKMLVKQKAYDPLTAHFMMNVISDLQRQLKEKGISYE